RRDAPVALFEGEKQMGIARLCGTVRLEALLVCWVEIHISTDCPIEILAVVQQRCLRKYLLQVKRLAPTRMGHHEVRVKSVLGKDRTGKRDLLATPDGSVHRAHIGVQTGHR